MILYYDFVYINSSLGPVCFLVASISVIISWRLVHFLIQIDDVSISFIGQDEVHLVHVKHMEGLSADHTYVAILVEEPVLIASTIAQSERLHLLCWLFQVELLIVEESIWFFQSYVFALSVLKTAYFQCAVCHNADL